MPLDLHGFYCNKRVFCVVVTFTICSMACYQPVFTVSWVSVSVLGVSTMIVCVLCRTVCYMYMYRETRICS